MVAIKALAEPLHQPIRSLVIIYCAWKFLLLLVAFAVPGPDYDLGTDIMFRVDGVEPAKNLVTHLVNRLCIKLSRWDAIYFLESARRGYVWEQEWAFGWGMVHLIGICSSFIPWDTITIVSLVAITISHVTHFLSVLSLYHLATTLQLSPEASFTAACLHIFAPGGLFLSAPYGESTFSFLNFFGMLLYAMSRSSASPDAIDVKRRPMLVIAAGISWGLASTVRSNGLLNGIVFATHILRHLPYFFSGESKLVAFSQMAVGTIGGLINLLGYVVPQVIAYMQFCHQVDDAPQWCSRTIPSIYGYVQRRYWNVGFLRYWEVANIPLFMMAAPMTIILIVSGVANLGLGLRAGGKSTTGKSSPAREISPTIPPPELSEEAKCRRIFALPQLVLAFLAPTNYHVQIITRLASGYPIPYIWLAERMQERPQKRWDVSWWMVRWMVIWSLVQGGLFANFLPPA